MKNTLSYTSRIGKALRRSLLSGALIFSLSAAAQSSMPAPGTGGPGPGGPGFGNSAPAPGSGGAFTPSTPPNGIGWNPGPMAPGPGWGGNNAWYNGWNPPATTVNPVVVNPNQGLTRVMACGYDNFGNWKAIPLVVSYQYNGVQYEVNVVNAWNPISQMWNRGIDMPAYNTSYYTHGVTYNFYAPLSTGTYYFNL